MRAHRVPHWTGRRAGDPHVDQRPARMHEHCAFLAVEALGGAWTCRRCMRRSGVNVRATHPITVVRALRSHRTILVGNRARAYSRPMGSTAEATPCGNDTRSELQLAFTCSARKRARPPSTKSYQAAGTS